MKRLSGVLLRRRRTEKPELPIVCLTGSSVRTGMPSESKTAGRMRHTASGVKGRVCTLDSLRPAVATETVPDGPTTPMLCDEGAPDGPAAPPLAQAATAVSVATAIVNANDAARIEILPSLCSESAISKAVLRPDEDHAALRLNARRNEARRNVRCARVDFHPAHLLRQQVDQMAERRRRSVDEHLRLADTAFAVGHGDRERRRRVVHVQAWNVAKDIQELRITGN